MGTTFTLNKGDVIHVNKKTGKTKILKPLQDSLDNITAIIEAKDEEIEELKEEINTLKDEQYKDGKISELEQEIERLREENMRGFPISEEEQNSIDKWKTKHIKAKHWDKKNNRETSSGAIGGRFSYNFIPTSIGIIGEVICDCGEKFCFQEIL